MEGGIKTRSWYKILEERYKRILSYKALLRPPSISILSASGRSRHLHQQQCHHHHDYSKSGVEVCQGSYSEASCRGRVLPGFGSCYGGGPNQDFHNFFTIIIAIKIISLSHTKSHPKVLDYNAESKHLCLSFINSYKIYFSLIFIYYYLNQINDN